MSCGCGAEKMQGQHRQQRALPEITNKYIQEAIHQEISEQSPRGPWQGAHTRSLLGEEAVLSP